MALQTNPHFSAIATDSTTSFIWEKLRTQTPNSLEFEPSTWVKLLNPPTAYSFDEAWLLCQVDADHWLAWIPDYGEILLHMAEFLSIEY